MITCPDSKQPVLLVVLHCLSNRARASMLPPFYQIWTMTERRREDDAPEWNETTGYWEDPAFDRTMKCLYSGVQSY